MKSRKNETQRDETIFGKQFAIGMFMLFVIVFLIQATNCTPYHPGSYPSYDVLYPGEAVVENPVAFIDVKDGEIVNVIWTNASIEDGKYNLVNGAFLQWAYDLKLEIKRLR